MVGHSGGKPLDSRGTKTSLPEAKNAQANKQTHPPEPCLRFCGRRQNWWGCTGEGTLSAPLR